MKSKTLKMMLFLLLLCLSHGIVYADTMELIYDGMVHLYNNEPISLYIDGNEIQTTVMPPIQFNGVVVVPAREVFSEMGATVEWRPNERKVYVETESKSGEISLIVLTIGSNEAWTNGEIRYLNMPAKLINDKVMVPIRFISEELGYAVNWSSLDRSIRIETGNGEITVLPEQGDKEEHTTQEETNTEEESVVPGSRDPWLYSEYIHYISETETLLLSNMEGLKSSGISVEENYYDKQVIIHLGQDYSRYLNEGKWTKDDGDIRQVEILHKSTETQIILTTATIKALVIGTAESQVQLKVVTPSEKYEKIVVLDAGHGAHDPGATYAGVQEKDLTLAISNAILAKLQDDPNIMVYATREDDTFLQLLERSEFSNQINPDLFISLHINSVDNASASGTETYYTEKADIRNKIFATMVQQALVDEFGTKNRGVKSNTFVVTKYTNAPAILIEIGFLTNESDRMMMTSANFTKRYAEVIYQCILEYYLQGYDIQ